MTSPKEAIALPRVGEKAPEFTCESYPEGKISLSDYRGKKKCRSGFYPKDDTPGCTKEMCAFTEDYSKFESADTVVFGISTDSVKSHEGFAAKFSLKQHLLADHTHEVGRKYGVVSEDKSTANRALFS